MRRIGIIAFLAVFVMASAAFAQGEYKIPEWSAEDYAYEEAYWNEQARRLEGKKLIYADGQWTVVPAPDYKPKPSERDMNPKPKPCAAEAVDHPAHYNTGKIEVIDAIEDWRLGFNDGNAVKYIARAGKKDPAKTLEDLEKARWCLDREIKRLRK